SRPRSSRGTGGRNYCATSAASALLDLDVRGVRVLHANDMVAAIDVMDLPGHPLRQVGEEVDAGTADILDGDVALHRCVQLVPAQDVLEVANAAIGRQRLDRASA